MKISHRQLLIAAAVAAASLALAPAGADVQPGGNAVKTGVDAWQAGRYDDAVRAWLPLAERGDPDAEFNMGQAYKLGRGVPTDLKLAQGWYEKAAQQGHEQAQANLGLILFQNGAREAAMPWIRKAADHGDPRAQYVLGTALFNGDVVAKDWPRAYALMTRAAAQGLPQAATSLTEMDGYITLADRQKGVELAQQMERSASAVAPSVVPAPARPVRVASSVPQYKAPAIVAAPPPLAAQKPAAAAKPAVVKPAPAKPAPVSMAAAGGRWRVQLGAYASVAGARGQWEAMSRRIGALAGLRPVYEPAGSLTRLRVGPLADRATADRVCASAKASGQACFSVAP